MEITCEKGKLEAGLKTVARACSRSTSLPVLENVLFSAPDTDEDLELRCNNLSFQISVWIDAEVLEPGAVTVPLRILRKLLKSLPKGRVELSCVDSKVPQFLVNAGGTTYNLVGVASSQFPNLKPPSDPIGFLVDPGALLSGLSRTLFAASDDEARPALMSVLTKVENDQLTLAAADGFRLSEYTTSLVTESDEPIEVLLPARALKELVRIGKRQKDPVVVLLEQNRFVFQLTDVVMLGTMAGWNYPDYQQIIPKHHVTSVDVDTARLLAACKAAAVFTQEDYADAVVLHVGAPSDSGEGQVLVLSPCGAGSEGGVCEIPAEVVGPEIEIYFNVEYLVDVLSVIESPTVSLDFGITDSAPVLIRESPGFLHVLMPVDSTCLKRKA